MTAILSVLAVILTAIWFYRTAESKGQPGLVWAVAGVLAYYAGFLLWMHVLLKNLMGGQFQGHGLWIGISMDVSATLLGVLCMVLLRNLVLMKKRAGG